MKLHLFIDSPFFNNNLLLIKKDVNTFSDKLLTGQTDTKLRL